MGNARQDRGKRTNVVVAAWLKAHGWERAEPTVGSETGQDVKHVPGHSIEVKARSDFDPRAWWRQAKANAKNAEVPAVVVRCNGQGETPGDYLVVRLLADDELALGPEASATLRALADQIAEETGGTSDR